MGNDLLIRVYPDQMAVETHEPKLTREELKAGQRYEAELAAAVGSAALVEERRRAAWRELARRFGPNRAAWIARELPQYAGVNPDTLPVESWNAAPVVRTLPTRFHFTVCKKGVPVPEYDRVGADIRPELPVLRGPQDTGDGAASLFEEASKWVADFESAVSAGMAIRLPLIASAPPPFSHVIVVGLREAASGSPLLEGLLRNHHYTGGLAFLPWGTPTNNTAEVKSGHSETAEDYERSYDIEIAAGAPIGDPARTNAARMKRALGIDPASDVFDRVDNGSDDREGTSQDTQTALWAVIGDYFFGSMLPTVLSPDHRARLSGHFSRYVRGRGPLPALRLGNLPFGVLPVTRVAPLSSTNAGGWRAALEDSRQLGTDGEAWQAFDAGLHRVLSELYPTWFKCAANYRLVPRVGSTVDPDRELIEILGMAPRGLTYRSRPFVDERFVGALLGALRAQVLAGVPGARWAADWVDAWDTMRDKTTALLGRLGAPATVRDAPLLKIFGWGEGDEISMPPIGPAGMYLPKLATDGKGTPWNASNTLFFDLLRRALQYSQNPAPVQQAITRLADAVPLELFNRAATVEDVVARLPKDPRPGAVARDTTAARRQLAQQILAARQQLPGKRFANLDQIDAVLHVGTPVVRQVAEPLAMLRFGQELEAVLRDTLDLCSHRLDAWLTSLAAKRLDGMRETTATGVHLGAYGWIEGLKRTEAAPTPAVRPEGGFIHSPSVAHASAAAVMRSAYLAHYGEADANVFRIDLTSSRVRDALRLIDGVRDGQSLGALLGYQFERGLHGESLDRYIDDFRALYPLVPPASQLGVSDATAPPSPGSPAASVESVPPRNVVDGLQLAGAWRDHAPNNPVDKLLTAAGAAAANLRPQLDRLVYALDATSDLLVSESVYQSVQGNSDRAGAALDASAGRVQPPEIESMATPPSGTSLGQRLCVLLPKRAAAADAGPRAAAEPRLDGWIGSVLGNQSSISYRAYVARPGGGEETVTRSLADLKIDPIDLVYLAATPAADEETEIERRIAYDARSQTRAAADAAVRVDLSHRQGGASGLSDALELARALLELIRQSTALRPDALCRPEDAPDPVFGLADIPELEQRATRARDTLATKVAQPLERPAEADPTAILVALQQASRFGIEGALPSAPNDPQLRVRAAAVGEQAKLRLADYASIPAVTTTAGATADAAPEDQQVDGLMRRMAALFGDGFVVLPSFKAPQADVLSKAVAQNGMLGPDAGHRALLWLQQVAETHSPASRLEDVLLLGEAWNPAQAAVPTMRLAVAQLPYCENRPWQALSDSEIATLKKNLPPETGTCADPPDGRPRGVVSLVVLTPATGLDFTSVAGLLIDQWSEVIPNKEVTTGLAFEFNQPNAQAPQVMLLALPPTIEATASRWDPVVIRDIVRDTFDLATVRLVDPDALQGMSGLLPGILLPADPARPGWARPVGLKSLTEMKAIFATATT